MAGNLDWSQCPVVESIPGKVRGAWVFAGRGFRPLRYSSLETSPIEQVLENFRATGDQF